MALARGIQRLSDATNRIALWGAVLGVIVMVAAAAYQVFARYLFDAPPPWTEELARYAMVWSGLLGASAAFHAQADPTLFPAMRGKQGSVGQVLRLVRTTGVLVFSIPVIYYSVFGPKWDVSRGFVGRSMGRTAEMLGVPMGLFSIAIPIAFVLIVVHALAQLSNSGHISDSARLAQTMPAPQDQLAQISDHQKIPQSHLR